MRAILPVLCLLLLACPTPAQNILPLEVSHPGLEPRRAGEGTAMVTGAYRLRATPYLPSSLAGGVGFLLVTMDNPDPIPRQVTFKVTQNVYGRAAPVVVGTHRTVTIPARGEATQHLTLPCCQSSLNLEVTLDGERRTWRIPGSNHPQPAVLFVGEEGNQAQQVLDMVLPFKAYKMVTRSSRGRTTTKRFNKLTKAEFKTLDRWGESLPPGPLPTGFKRDRQYRVHHLSPVDLPRSWRLLSGYPLLVLTGMGAGWGKEAQEVVLDYLRGGGLLLAMDLERMPAGPLRKELLTSAATGVVSGSCGLGLFLACTGPWFAGGTVRSWLEPRWELYRDGMRQYSGPLPDRSYNTMEIPGVGKVPVTVFMVLILFFVLLAGPGCWFYCHRVRRRPMLLLAAVPVTGALFTLAILLYGFFSEGLSIKGVLASYTVLDQRRHHKTEWVVRTVYAGMSPAALSPRPGTLVGLGQLRPGRDGIYLTVDDDRGGEFKGNLVPSRIPTPLNTISQGPARERIRFKRRDDGGLEVLAGPDFRPRFEAGQPDGNWWFLVRDHAGRWYSNILDSSRGSDPDGILIPATPTAYNHYLDNLATRFIEALPDRNMRDNVRARYGSRYFRGRITMEASGAMPGVLDRRARRTLTLAPGEYLGIFAGLPSRDELGLRIHYHRQLCLVKGILAREDFID